MRRDGLGALPRLLALLLAAQAAFAPATAYAATLDWERWQKIPGVIDVDGPRSDGSLVVAGSAALYLVDPAGKVAPFARGPGGYHEDAGAEAYLASSPGGTLGAAGCTFVRDETFLLRLHTPIGVNRVNAAGDESGSFANLPGVTALNGIVFDTGGAFDHRLLVSGRSGSKTVIFAVDCNGNVQVITRSAPALEGGLAVAPTGFGAFGGSLIAPDELSGKIYAITPGGVVSVVARPRLRTGSDIGVESVGFVPPGFTSRGGSVYYPDRFSRNNPHPGTDSLLRLTSAQLPVDLVRDGDLLVATEGGASLVAVRCDPTCAAIPVVTVASKAHGEGHIAFTLNPAQASPTATPGGARTPSAPFRPPAFVGDWGIPAVAFLILLALLALLGVQALRRRR